MKLFITGLMALLLCSCQNDFLAMKPEKALLVPTTLSDFQALLDDVSIMNVNPAVDWVATDDFSTTDAGWQGFVTPDERNSYIWAVDIYEGGLAYDWVQPYKQVLNANIVLDGLKTYSIKAAEQQAVNNITGSALFFRSMAFYNLLQKFAVPYQVSTAAAEKGIPLRLTADINIQQERASLEEGYNQIITDLEKAAELLSVNNKSKTRPVKSAALALLARTYLMMNNYPKALLYADECLGINDTLLDYNDTSPFNETGNQEVIFNCGNLDWSFMSSALVGAPDAIYNLYHDNDLRKLHYFFPKANDIIRFKSINAVNAGRFSGLAVDELYLIKAECHARLNRAEFGIDVLNLLLIKRWVRDEFLPYQADNQTDALKTILAERRKELVNRGTRWTDLRRLNLESSLQVVINRTLMGKDYVLLPNDKRYTYPIPQNEINASGIEQNER